MDVVNVDIKDKTINDNVYYARPFPPLVALELLGDLQAIVTSSVGDISAEIDKTNEETLQNNSVNMAQVIAGIGKNLRGKAVVTLASRILNAEYVFVQRPEDEEPIKLDKNMQNIVFTGKISEMLEVIYFVLEVNYADFFVKAKSLIGIVGKLTNK